MVSKRSLEELVDDYLEKHNAAVTAGRAWDSRKCKCSEHDEPLLRAFQKAHNARAAAFCALRDARKK